MKLGDVIELVAKPIAKSLNLSCLDDKGYLKPESSCGQRKQFYNNLGDSFYDVFWPKPKENNNAIRSNEEPTNSD